ncbi:FACT complex subunit spt16 [Dinochytrium kinnereticum]|nr:FACT complex subunit spt16 [Dinochytrium kinnereticum]
MVEVDGITFHRRVRVLLDTWKDSKNSSDFGNADSLLLIAGSTDDDVGYQKTSCLQLWLWGYEFPDTITLFLENKLVFMTSQKKASIIETVKNIKGVENVEIEFLIRSKDESVNKGHFATLISYMKGSRSGTSMGMLAKDKVQGKFIKEWRDNFNDSGIQEVDITAGISTVLASKDELDLENIKQACKLTSLIMKNYFIEEFQSIIDQGKKITHEKLATLTESCLTDEKRRNKVKFPKEGKETNYKFLLELQAHLMSSIKDGILCSELYQIALDYVSKSRPELKDNFVKNIGFGIGIEFKESAYSLSSKSSRSLKPGMVLNLVVGFSNLENPDAKDARSKIYSLLLSDIIQVKENGAELLTSFDKDFKDISWEMNDDNESEEDVIAEPVRNGRSSAVLKTKLREKDEDMTTEQRRALHQKQLAEQRNSEGKQRFSESADTGKGLEKATFRKFECYRQESLLPKNVDQLRTLVKHEEGEITYLRFNFLTPGQSIGKKEAVQPFENPNATFVKTIMYKSTDFSRFGEIHRDVSDFKKEIQKREAERKEMSDLVEQAKLIEVKGRRPLLLREVFVRPAIDSGKRLPGDLEIHTNGLRYQSGLRSDSKIDILFSNIKHLFYQPCDGELIVVLHIRLNNPIIIAKKKHKDIQFYREVSEASFDETGNRKRRYNQGDDDEFAAEQEERRRRAQLNQDFKQFADKIKDASKKLVDVDMPLRDLGFQGVPFKQPVLLLPTVNCLVHLIEPPFLVVTIAEIEIVHLERVRFGLKNFDLVVVFKDFSQPVQHINCIPTDQLEHVKEWLDSVDVAYTEGPTNLSWPQIMKTINEDPANFFEEGGWSFLQPESENEEDDEEDGSEYVPSEDADESSDDSDEDYSESGSDASYSEESEEESGEDWDELDRKAAKVKFDT